MAERNKTPESFAEICAAMGKNESDYAVQEGAANKVNADICRNRLWLMAAYFNDGKKVEFTDTKQWKYTPWHEIIPDAERPFGFRLSFLGCAGGCVTASLGARPPYLDSDDAEYAGEKFIEEWEAWYHYMNLAFQEI